MVDTSTCSHIGLSCKTDQWFTPPEILIRVTGALGGGIELDPCGSTESNKLVRARRVIMENSIDTDWGDAYSAFCNPPSGRYTGSDEDYKGLSNPVAFFKKLGRAFDWGSLHQYIFLGYSIEQIQYIQAKMDLPSNCLICFPKKRIRFVDQTGNRNSPPHSNFILYRGPNHQVFYREFHDLGVITTPY